MAKKYEIQYDENDNPVDKNGKPLRGAMLAKEDPDYVKDKGFSKTADRLADSKRAHTDLPGRGPSQSGINEAVPFNRKNGTVKPGNINPDKAVQKEILAMMLANPQYGKSMVQPQNLPQSPPVNVPGAQGNPAQNPAVQAAIQASQPGAGGLPPQQGGLAGQKLDPAMLLQMLTQAQGQ